MLSKAENDFLLPSFILINPVFLRVLGPEVMHVYSATSISDPLDSAEADAQQQWPRLPDVPLWDTEPQLHSAITTG